MTMEYLTIGCRHLGIRSRAFLSTGYKREQYTALLHTIIRSGCVADYGSNLGLVPCAYYRTTSDPLDQIYGIMQVFDFRLGKSAENASPDMIYTLPELEDQFGEALLLKNATASQLYFNTDITPLGKGWRIRQTSRIPEFGNRFGCSLFRSDWKQLCSLSIREIGKQKWGWIEGSVCDMKRLQQSWLRVYGEDQEKTATYHGTQAIALDFSLRCHLLDAPENEAPMGKAQHKVVASIISKFEGIRVLLLGGNDTHDLKIYYGLMLQSCNDNGLQYWCRLGVCQWHLAEKDEQRKRGGGCAFIDNADRLLLGGKSHWESFKGNFG